MKYQKQFFVGLIIFFSYLPFVQAANITVPKKALYGHSNYVMSVAFSPDSKTIASASWDKTVRLWDVETRKSLGEPLVGHSNYVNSVAFSPDGKTIASASWDKTVRLWDVETRKPLGEPLTGHSDYVNSVAFSPDGKTIASASWDKTVRLWDVETRKLLGEPLTGHSFFVLNVAFSPDGKTIVSVSGDKTVRLWNVETRKSLGKPLTGHSNSVVSVAFSPDGKTIASASWDKTVRLWNVETRKPLGEPLVGHSISVNSVAFSPDGKTIVSGSSDKTVRLWDIETKKPLSEPLVGHSISVMSVAFSPDGKTIASGSSDKTVRLWDVVGMNLYVQELPNLNHESDLLKFSIISEKAIIGQYPDLKVRFSSVLEQENYILDIKFDKKQLLAKISPDGTFFIQFVSLENGQLVKLTAKDLHTFHTLQSNLRQHFSGLRSDKFRVTKLFKFLSPLENHPHNEFLKFSANMSDKKPACFHEKCRYHVIGNTLIIDPQQLPITISIEPSSKH